MLKITIYLAISDIPWYKICAILYGKCYFSALYFKNDSAITMSKKKKKGTTPRKNNSICNE